eukprot:SAG31_NODE_48_length_30945_cov_16.254263_6_plen_385_part_00
MSSDGQTDTSVDNAVRRPSPLWRGVKQAEPNSALPPWPEGEGLPPPISYVRAELLPPPDQLPSKAEPIPSGRVAAKPPGCWIKLVDMGGFFTFTFCDRPPRMLDTDGSHAHKLPADTTNVATVAQVRASKATSKSKISKTQQKKSVLKSVQTSQAGSRSSAEDGGDDRSAEDNVASKADDDGKFRTGLTKELDGWWEWPVVGSPSTVGELMALGYQMGPAETVLASQIFVRLHGDFSALLVSTSLYYALITSITLPPSRARRATVFGVELDRRNQVVPAGHFKHEPQSVRAVYAFNFAQTTDKYAFAATLFLRRPSCPSKETQQPRLPSAARLNVTNGVRRGGKQSANSLSTFGRSLEILGILAAPQSNLLLLGSFRSGHKPQP